MRDLVLPEDLFVVLPGRPGFNGLAPRVSVKIRHPTWDRRILHAVLHWLPLAYLVLLRHELLDGRVRRLDEAGGVGRGRARAAVQRGAAVGHLLGRRDELAVVAAHCGGDASCRLWSCDRLFRKT